VIVCLSMIPQSEKTAEELIESLTLDQIISLRNILETLLSEHNQDNIREKLISIRDELDFDLTSWNTSLTLKPKIQEVLDILAGCDTSVIAINCNKSDSKMKPAKNNKRFKNLSREFAAKQRLKRLSQKEQKEKEEEERRNREYLGLLESIEKGLEILLGIPEILEKVEILYQTCITNGYDADNITVLEVTNRHFNQCNDIYCSIYFYLFGRNGSPSAEGFRTLIGDRIQTALKMNHGMLLKEFPASLTGSVTQYVLFKVTHVQQNSTYTPGPAVVINSELITSNL
jgi:hypothetical protein